jgi:uncharacterized protein YprB with RNaseH-like and TPR domain
VDIETTDLAGVGAGILLCACVRATATGKITTLRIEYRDEWNPSEEGFLQTEETLLIKQIIEELSKYDLWIGHNLDGFDIPYLRSRAQARNVPFFLEPFTYDTMKAFGRVKLRTVLNRIGKPTKSMAMIADFLGLDQLKTAVYPREWWLTIWGSASQRESAMQEIIDHCKRDVRQNHEIYDVLLPMDKKGIIKRWM